MSLRFKMLWTIFGILGLGIIVTLLIWDIPPPAKQVKINLTSDQLLRHQTAP